MAILTGMGRSKRYGSVYRKRRRDGTLYDGWFARYREAGRRLERGAFMSEEDAETFLAGRRVERSTHKALGLQQLRRISVRELAQQYLAWARAHRRAATAKMHGYFLKHLVAQLGDREASTIRADDVMRVFTGLRLREDRPLQASSLHTVLTAISAAFTWAAENHHVRVNPCARLARRLPRIDVNEPPYLSPEQLSKIYAAVPAEIRPLTHLWGEAGLRFTEAHTLRWSDVGRDLGRVTVRVEIAKGHRSRIVPLTALARKSLEEIRAAHAVPMWDGPVFPEVNPRRVSRLFREAMQAIGAGDVTPHVLRHAFGSGLMRAGVDLATIQRLMGHRAIATTIRYACHAPTDAGTLAIEALERARHAAPPSGASASQSRKAT